MVDSTLNFNYPVAVGSLEAYIYRVNQIPMLTQEEEQELAWRFQNEGDLESARRLVMSHLRFVVRVATGYAGYGLSPADLIQEGNIGLMKAVKRFDPSQGVRLVTFAVHWIKAEIHEFIIRNWRIVKIATTKAQRKLFFNLRNAKKRLGWFTHEEIKDVATALNVSAEEVVKMEQRLNASDICFDAHPDDDDEDSHFAPAFYLEDKRADPARQLEDSDWTDQGRENLQGALARLDDRSQDILHSRWLVEKKKTLQELADRYLVSPERIRQLEKQAMQKLKEVLNAL